MLVDFKKFERKIRWREFFFDEDDEQTEWTQKIFKKETTSQPKGSKHLNNFLTGVKSELVKQNMSARFTPVKTNISLL